MNTDLIQKAYDIAKEQYAAIGVDTEAAIAKMKDVNIKKILYVTSIHNAFLCSSSSYSVGLEAPIDIINSKSYLFFKCCLKI